MSAREPAGGGRARSASRDDSRRGRVSGSRRNRVASSSSEDDSPDPPAEDAQPGKLPPLDKEDLTRLVERFAGLGFPLPKNVAKLSQEDARCAYNVHMETWGLTQREIPHARGPLQPRVFVHRPPMENCEYRLDLSDAKLRELLQLPHHQRANALPIWCSASAPVNAQLQARGYTEQPLTYMETDANLPPVLPSAAAPDDEEEEEDGEQEEEDEGAPLTAPARLILPPTLPPLPKGKPAAQLIVQTFEEYVVHEGRPYSPLRLWTQEARKKMGEGMMKQTSNFGRRAMIYLYILSRNEDPATMTEKEGELRAQMMAWKHEMGAEAAKQVNFDAAVKAADQRIAAAGMMDIGR